MDILNAFRLTSCDFVYFCSYSNTPMNKRLKYHKWLLPAGFLFGMVVNIRNYLYNHGIFKSVRFNLPVLSIGNLTVGGTGKTPHTEYLVRLLRNNYKIAVLSRGYGRRTSGYQLANTNSTQENIGDEPLQIYMKYPDVTVAVDESRVDGISKLLTFPNPDVILLDDAYQHRAVTASLNILIVNYHRNIFQDRLLPAGLLREPHNETRRADIVVVSKCPDEISENEMSTIKSGFNLANHQSVYFTKICYKELVHFNNISLSTPMSSIGDNTSVLIVTGIASPMLIETELKRYTSHITLISFPDHHQFTDSDIERIDKEFGKLQGESKIIVTTEKDATRLRSMNIESALQSKIFILPIAIEFIKDGKEFDSAIIGHIDSFRK